MKTTATEHKQRCSVPGCMNDALVTLAHGKYVASPKGHCRTHTMDDLISERERNRREEDQLLRDLGFDV